MSNKRQTSNLPALFDSKIYHLSHLIYQNLDDLIKAAQQGNKDITQFECSIFNGKYVTDDIDEKYLKNLEDLRSDKSKSLRQSNLN